jgi:hypothetical protein
MAHAKTKWAKAEKKPCNKSKNTWAPGLTENLQNSRKDTSTWASRKPRKTPKATWAPGREAKDFALSSHILHYYIK